MPRLIAELSVGQSAVGSVADTISALAPFVMAAWMAGISDAGVAAVPLVSVPVSPSASSAAIAPPEFALSEVVKYELPRFLGMTKTLRPVLSAPDDDVDDVDDAVGPLPDDEQAASRDDAATSGTTSHGALDHGALDHGARLTEPFMACILSIASKNNAVR